MFKKILIGLAAVLVLLLIVVALQPSRMHVVRSASIAAPAADVFPHVNDLHQWEAWSPWVKMDPEMKQTYSGAAAGQGAEYSWDGNSNVGAGKMTIVDSKPDDRVQIKLEFSRPFKGTNDVEFTFKPERDGTDVSWSMEGKKNFVTKAMGLFIDMDDMVGSQFSKGLADLKAIVETARKESAPKSSDPAPTDGQPADASSAP